MSDETLTSYEDARRVVVTILFFMHDNLGDRPIEGMSDLNEDERNELLVMAMARIIEHTICEQTEFNVIAALRGYRALHYHMREHIIALCQERKPTNATD